MNLKSQGVHGLDCEVFLSSLLSKFYLLDIHEIFESARIQARETEADRQRHRQTETDRERQRQRETERDKEKKSLTFFLN